MANTKTLREGLLEYDGQNPTILSELSHSHRRRTTLLSELVCLASDEQPMVSEGATWIIKEQLEHGKTLSQQDVKRLTSGLDGVTAWQAQLHVCQSIGHILVPEGATVALDKWLTGLLDSPRPFLRAWALDALCRLHEASLKVHALLDQMEKDPAASVRARVRNLKRLFGDG